MTFKEIMRLLLDTCTEVAKNLSMGAAPVRAWRLARPRTACSFADQDDLLDRYAFQTLNALRQIVGAVKDLDIAEIGPGDHLGSGLSLLAAGAASYTAIDRFPGNYGSAAAKA